MEKHFASLWVALGVLSFAGGGVPLAFGDLKGDIQAAILGNQNVKDVGVAIAVIEPGQGPQFYSFGLRDRAKGLKVTKDTRFVLGSLSKAFTVTGLKILEARGLLSFSNPIRDVLPQFSTVDLNASKNATLVDLLSHQTGMPAHDAFWYLTSFNAGELLNRFQYLGSAKDGSFGFRRGFEYNNLMYAASGLALEKASGKKWAGFLQDEILNPMKMTQTTTDIATFSSSSDAAKGYWDALELPYKDVDSISGAAGVNSSAVDLAKWLGFWLKKGVATNGNRLLSEASFEQIVAPQVETTPGGGSYYAMGWRTFDYKGHRTIRHGGNMDGFLSNIVFYPEDGRGFVVLTNQNDTKAVSAVSKVITESWWGVAAHSRNDGLAEELLQEKVITPNEEAPSRVAPSSGYFNPAYGWLQVTQKAKQLWVNLAGHNWQLLDWTPQGSTLAASKITVDMGGRFADFPVSVELSSSGSIEALSVPFEENAAPFRFVWTTR